MKYSPQLTKEIAQAVLEGSTQKDAATLAGISEETFYQWMKKPEFSEPVKKAELECKNRNIKIIQKAAITTWQAAAWWLERKYNQEFALKTHLQHSGTVDIDAENAKKQIAQSVREFMMATIK